LPFGKSGGASLAAAICFNGLALFALYGFVRRSPPGLEASRNAALPGSDRHLKSSYRFNRYFRVPGLGAGQKSDGAGSRPQVKRPRAGAGELIALARLEIIFIFF
jgi:hypothetical protein